MRKWTLLKDSFSNFQPVQQILYANSYGKRAKNIHKFFAQTRSQLSLPDTNADCFAFFKIFAHKMNNQHMHFRQKNGRIEILSKK